MAVCVLRIFLVVPWVGLKSVIVAFSGHTHGLYICYGCLFLCVSGSGPET